MVPHHAHVDRTNGFFWSYEKENKEETYVGREMYYGNMMVVGVVRGI